jgi:hypothetical protein
VSFIKSIPRNTTEPVLETPAPQVGFLRFLFRLILAVIGLIALVLVVGSLLPRQFAFDTKVTINAPAAKVYEQINDLRRWQEWTKFNRETNAGLLELDFSQPSTGVDAVMSWRDHRGKGRLWITDSESNRQVDYSVDFEGFPRMTNTLRLNESGEGSTEVLWHSEGKLPRGPFYGLFGMYFSGALQQQYDTDLQKLKSLLETPQ